MYQSKNPMLKLPDALVKEIEQVTEHQIDELLQAVIHRANQLQPEYEAILLSLSTDPDRRSAELENMIRYIRSICQMPETNRNGK